MENLSNRLGNQFQSEFKLAHKKLKDWKDQIYFKKVNLKRRLFKEQRNEKSLLSVAGSFIETFFKTKGKNVILAIMVFSLLFFPAFLVQNKIFDSPFFLKKFIKTKKYVKHKLHKNIRFSSQISQYKLEYLT